MRTNCAAGCGHCSRITNPTNPRTFSRRTRHPDGKDREGLPASEYRVCLHPPRDGGETPVRGPFHPKYMVVDKSGLMVAVGTGSTVPTREVEPAK